MAYRASTIQTNRCSQPSEESRHVTEAVLAEAQSNNFVGG